MTELSRCAMCGDLLASPTAECKDCSRKLDEPPRPKPVAPLRSRAEHRPFERVARIIGLCVIAWVLTKNAWSLTERNGVRDISTNKAGEISSGTRVVNRREELTTQGRSLINTSVEAPFLIRLEYGSNCGEGCAVGAEELYFWFFGYSTKVKVLKTWIIQT